MVRMRQAEEAFSSAYLKKGLTPRTIQRFRDLVYGHYKEHRRALPWRRTRDPFRILVSEVMLQQTQADRVIGKYRDFTERFPDIRTLAEAPLAEVLMAWQGLGYNRRALSLHALAQTLRHTSRGRVPDNSDKLQALPGIGRYTAAAVLAFAWNRPVVFIETNIRTVFIHFFFHDKPGVSDREILPLVAETLDTSDPRAWYNALMDYGVMLKKEFKNPARRSAHYQRQSPFKGSDRQIRGLILRLILEKGGMTMQRLLKQLGPDVTRSQAIIRQLVAEGFLKHKTGKLSVPKAAPGRSPAG
ncbi:MAG: A/G-specific adenine glycosylase [Nitrospirae bacterium]|nr:MAG: A/G-specific adenine glycosylase [Nitrospirota bacterium]